MRFHLAALALVVTGCSGRVAPYHFRAPLLSGVSAPELASPRPAADEQPAQRLPGPAKHRGEAAAILARGLVVEPGDSLVGQLRSLVGIREKEMTATAFAVATLRAIGAKVDDDLVGTREGEDLVSLAQSRDAWTEAPGASLGDLLVFDAVVDAKPASAIGVVIAVDRRGVIEFIALLRGVVRRGYVDPARPDVKRDESGRVVNTHIRGGRSGDSRGARYLAGELLAGRVTLDRLL